MKTVKPIATLELNDQTFACCVEGWYYPVNGGRIPSDAIETTVWEGPFQSWEDARYVMGTRSQKKEQLS